MHALAATTEENAGVELLTTATLQGSVFVDSQRNMVHDRGEQGLAGVEVKLIDQLGNVVARQKTDASGEFSFLGVDPGLYDLEAARIDGYVDGGQRAGSSAGDALFDRAIRGIDLEAGEAAEGYAFTVLSPEIKPGETLPLPKPILHTEEKSDPTTPATLSVIALVSASPVVPQSGNANTAPTIEIETPIYPSVALPPAFDLPVVAGSTLTIPVSGLDAADTIGEVVIARVDEFNEEHNIASPLSSMKAMAPRGKLLAGDSLVTLCGDFDGDGKKETATYERGRWWIDHDEDGQRSENDLEVAFGPADGLPVVADTNGDGKDELVVVPQGMARKWLRHVQPKRTASQHVHAFAGDWLGTGRESIGLSTAGEWWLDLNGNRQIDQGDRFGEGTIATAAPPTVGDANHDGADELAWDTPAQGDTEMSSRNADRAFESLYER